jgi:ATP phosphoribosyltransferase
MIRLGLAKGRLAADADRFCTALGLTIRSGVLSYRTAVRGLAVSVHLIKAPDVARLLRRNLLDLGLVGDEWLLETGVSADRRCFEARSYEATVCLLMSGDDPRPPRHIRSAASPYPNLAHRLLRDLAPAAEILAVSGSSEALVPGIADACVDLVETGASADLNGLAVRQRFDQVTTHLVRSEHCDAATVSPVVDLLAGAVEAAR